MSNQLASEINDLYARLQLGDDGDDGEGLFKLNNTWAAQNEASSQYSLVGRFITDRSINVTAKQDTMSRVWRPVRGVWIKELSPNLFLFQFGHEVDMNRVINDGPWSFDQHLLVLRRLENGVSPHQVQLFHAEFWVQVYNLPVGFMSEKVAEHIGNYIGTFVEADRNNFNGGRREFMRIRVSLDIRKSLKTRMKIQKEGEGSSWINFKYERLPGFCFFCGVIGHSDRFCELFIDFPNKNVEKNFGVWLRAPNRRTQVITENRWLRQGPPPTIEMAAGVQSSDDRAGMARPIVTGLGSNFNGSNISKNQEVLIVNEEKQGNNLNVIGNDMHGNKGKDLAVKGAVLVGNHNSNMLGLEGGCDNGPGTLIIIDSKRRRMNEGLSNTVQIDVEMGTEDTNLGSSPKNLIEAGPVDQARRAL
ncbi:hypothetical protein LguiA_030841 [Lonicera macranthoides]